MPIQNTTLNSISKMFGMLGGKTIPPELANSIKAIGHKGRLHLSPAPAHRVLGQSREALASLRLGLEGQKELGIIQSSSQAGFTPVFAYQDLETPQRVMFQGKSVLMETLSNSDVMELLTSPERCIELMTGQGAQFTLTPGEQRALQDYMGREGLSIEINNFLRGEPNNQPMMNASQFTEMATLMISGLNAIPPDANPGVHCLHRGTMRFEAIHKAAVDKTPFVPDSFISIKQLESKDIKGPLPPINPLFGDTMVLVISPLAKDIRNVSGKFDQEREALIAPFESFDVKTVDSPSKGGPTFILIGRSRMDPPPIDHNV